MTPEHRFHTEEHLGAGTQLSELSFKDAFFFFFFGVQLSEELNIKDGFTFLNTEIHLHSENEHPWHSRRESF